MVHQIVMRVLPILMERYLEVQSPPTMRKEEG
jgi:hypothetical protein